MDMRGARVASSIRCQSLSIDYPHGPRAVDDACLSVPSGEIVSLIGPSGCGKTTLLRLIAQLESPTSGTVLFDPPASRKGESAFVFQQPTLMPWRTAVENVTLPLELIGSGTNKERHDAAIAMLGQVGLAGETDRFPHQLSGGMKMRVSIARALITEPHVLMLDEPFAAIDDMLRTQLGQLLLDLWERRRFTAVLVTHNIAEAILLSHHVAVMHNGQISSQVKNPLPWPRADEMRRSSLFGQFYGQVSDALRGRS